MSLSLVVYLLLGLLAGPVAAAAELSLLKLSKPHPVPATPVGAKPKARTDEAAQHAWKGAPKVTWPAAGTVAAAIPAAGTARKAAGSLPVRLRQSA
ncbi:hypothetical protein ACIOC1_32790, partial [Streptomyces sp. NPDC088197]|uniref:hypothetical protein n=1 Tax=Streptomyces sp. NPDC088197 TaxID=3365840 RepID=UPI00380E94B9